MRNRLGAVGGAAIAVALERNTTLTSLDLAENDLGDVGGAAVAGALERNTALTSLTLGCNGVRDDTLERVRRLLSGRVVVAGPEAVDGVSVKAAVVAPPRGTKRGAPG